MKKCKWCKAKEKTKDSITELIHIVRDLKRPYCPDAAKRNEGILWFCSQGVEDISYCQCGKEH